MRILFVHNFYREPGGEDDVFEAEKALLAAHGHAVFSYTRHNEEIASYGLAQKAVLPLRTLWAADSYRELQREIRGALPDVVHFHNTFPLISPAGYYACRAAGVPVVQSLHNPRIVCPAATLFRDGHQCHECLGRTLPWPGIWHGCYRSSRTKSAVIAGMITIHNLLGTWRDLVDRYIIFHEVYREVYEAAGIPAEKIAVKPHFLMEDPAPRQCDDGVYALFVGRLVEEKGLGTLLAAWENVDFPLYIRGEGPLRERVAVAAQRNPKIRWIPRPSRAEYFDLVRGARFLVSPSEWNEPFGRVLLDAFACAVPVICSDTPASQALVEEGVTGLMFPAGDIAALRNVVLSAITDKDRLQAIARRGRLTYEAKYTAERNYDLLCELYTDVMRAHAAAATS